MLGAAMGGVMADYLGWRWEFGVQIPILVFALLVALIVMLLVEQLLAYLASYHVRPARSTAR